MGSSPGTLGSESRLAPYVEALSCSFGTLIGSDGYIRRLLVVGATAVMRLARQDNASRAWAAKVLKRKSAKLAAVALANKTARIAWVVMTRGVTYAAPAG